MHPVLERAQAQSEDQESNPPFLEVRDERGLFPDLTPDRVIIQKIKRIDPQWRVEWHRSRGRFCLFHDHKQFGRAQVPTIIVEGSDGRFMPLDERSVHQVEFGAWAERNFKDTTEFDEFLDRVVEAREEKIEEHNREQRMRWVKAHAKQMYRSFQNGTFFNEPEAPSPVYT